MSEVYLNTRVVCQVNVISTSRSNGIVDSFSQVHFRATRNRYTVWFMFSVSVLPFQNLAFALVWKLKSKSGTDVEV